MPEYMKKDAGSGRLLPEAEIEKRAREIASEMKPRGTKRGAVPPHVAIEAKPSPFEYRAAADQLLAERGWVRMKSVNEADLDNLDDAGFRGLDEFLVAVRDARTRGKFDKRLEALETKAPLQQESSGAAGGFVVPQQFEAGIRMRAERAAPWLSSITSYMATSNSVFFPAVDEEDRSSSEVGGFKLQRTGEGGTISADRINFRAMELRLRKAAGLVTVSNELLFDGVGLEDRINDVFGRAEAMMRAEDFVRGNGSGQPLGFLNSSAVYTQAKGNAGTDEFLFENAYAMFSRLTPESQGAAFWLMHPSVFPQLAQFVGGEGTDLGPNFLINAASRPSNLLGLPIQYHESASLVGDLGDVCLVDPREYLHIRQPLRVDVSEHHLFDEDATAFRVVLRDDGQPIPQSTLTDTKGWESSPFVVLAART